MQALPSTGDNNAATLNATLPLVLRAQHDKPTYWPQNCADHQAL
jgi:hypothetical protein